VLSDWYFVVQGDPSDVALLEDLLRASPDHAVERDEPSGERRLRSARLAGITDHEAAWTTVREVLIELSDAAAAHAGTRLHLRPGGLGRTRPDGRSDLYVHPEPAVARARAFPPTVLVNGQVVGEAQGARLLRLQAGNPHVRLALHFLNGEESWFDLYKAYEAIRDGSGGEERLTEKGWAARNQIRRFSGTANSYAAVGDAARHAQPRWRPPKHPMTLAEADEFVRGLLSRWLAELT
jgi:hypothetical protein